MTNLSDKTMGMFVVLAWGLCASAALATDPDPIQSPIDSIAIGDLDGDGQPEMLVSNLTHAHPELDLVMSQSGVSTRIVTLGYDESVLWENCLIVDELGWNGSRGIFISTEEGTSEGGVIVKCRVIDSANLLLLGQAIGIVNPEEDEVGAIWLAQWRGDSNPDGTIDVVDLTDALSSAPFLFDEDNIQHRALVGAADINIDGVLDADEFMALTLSMELSDLPAHSGTLEWRRGLLGRAISFFACLPCRFSCDSAIRDAARFIEQYNLEWNDYCAEIYQDGTDLEEMTACYQKYLDAQAHLLEMVQGMTGKCYCAILCTGLQLLMPPGIPIL
ncbi:MAG: hypothetical protein K8R92_02950 [Planctomycetes bacterium]|nr:hypothetical protein [Planctomycetota bacterium]